MKPAAPPRYDDAAAREAIRTSLSESLLVEASAGTGKTHELVQRIVAVLEAGARIEGIVAVTFTNKAAGELELRLREALDAARGRAPDAARRASLEDALERLEEASIGTIHSFCARILRERPVEAGVDPAFVEIEDQEARRIHSAAFRAWLAGRLRERSGTLERAFARLAMDSSGRYGTPLEQLEQASWRLAEWRDHPSPWRRDPFDRRAEIGAILPVILELRTMAGRSPSDELSRSLASVSELAGWLERRDRTGNRNDDETEAHLLELLFKITRPWLKKGRAKMFAEGLPREKVLARLEDLKVALGRFLEFAGADLAALLRDELWQAVEEYEARKQAAGKLDFLDLLLRTARLLRENQAVRSELQRRFTHLFIDEFQDTDPLQAEILLLLAAADPRASSWLEAAPAAGKLFLVGDPKQSIYKFRRADVALYARIRERLEAQGVRRVVLTKSFRSVRPIQECVNAAFESEMVVGPGQPGYTPLEEHRPALESQPAVVMLPVPDVRNQKGEITQKQIDASVPHAVVAYADWLLHDSGWQVCEEDGRMVPVAPGHIAILFRRQVNFGQDSSRDYARALQNRGIPHILAGSKSFHDRDEIITLRTALAAIEWPNDELSVWAALRGSLFAIADAVLLRYQERFGRLYPRLAAPATPLAAVAPASSGPGDGEPADPEFAPVIEALDCLAGLHRGRNRRPIADTLNALLEATRAHAAFALRPGGSQILANVYRLCDLAREFELSGGISFRNFVEDLLDHAGGVDTAEALASDSSSGGVRLMTVHSAKGLEFPVVILADITARLHSRVPERYVDPGRGVCASRLLGCTPAELFEHETEETERERAEGVRVAYVAATRARDLLVVPVVEERENPDGWTAPLEKVLRQSERAQRCDLATLKLACEENFGVEREDLIEEGPGAEAGRDAYRSWRAATDAAVERGLAKSIDVVTASAAVEGPDYECEVRLERVPRRAGRPAGPRFGSLVHAVLRDVELDADRERIGAVTGLQARIHGAPDEEAAAAAGAVEAALAHPLLGRARRAGRLQREYPVVTPLDGNRVLEGVIDLAFVEGGTWHVVDFKTDEDIQAGREKYEGQLRWYALALARFSGQPVFCWLLSV